MPAALCYEMIRTASQETDLGNLADHLRGDWAFVDGQFLLHFLLYLNHNKLNMDSHAKADIANMEWLTSTQDISHRETCLSLLG